MWSKSWPVWECEPIKFQRNYDDKEICLIIEGQAKISSQNDNIYFIKAGDLVEFPAELYWGWKTQVLKKLSIGQLKKKDFFFLYC